VNLELRRENSSDADWILEVLVREWNGPLIERTNEFIDASKLSAIVALLDGVRVGLATMLFEESALEIITINCFEPHRGIGTAMLERIETEASNRGLEYLKLFTTNDNLDALRFYQRRGFRLEKVWKDSMTEARKIKTSIPLIGHYEIPLYDEIELWKDIV
jgi:ribosomal protein S18 acetylase RimI-like enzyme